MTVLERLRQLYRSRRPVRWAVEALVLAAIVAGVSAWQTRNHLSGEAPPFSLPRWGDLTPVTAASLHGKPTMVVFWAPWCSVCKAQSPNVSWVRSVMGDRANVVSVVTSFESMAEVEHAVRTDGVDYPVLLDTSGVAREFRVRAFPTVYFLGADGRVRHSVQGYTTGLGLLLRLWAS